MAFFNKMGSILRQSASKQANHQLLTTNPSFFQMIRCMSSSKLFVGGLSYSTDEMSLREAFSAFGDVHEARVIMDRETGRSRGFGFITYSDTEAASAAIQALDQRELHGRVVRVNYANDRPQGGGGYGGGGGYSGGGGYGGGGSGYGGSSYGGGGGYGVNSYGSGGYGGNTGGYYGGDIHNSSPGGGFANGGDGNVGSGDGGGGDASMA